jgi:hypothetical protein
MASSSWDIKLFSVATDRIDFCLSVSVLEHTRLLRSFRPLQPGNPFKMSGDSSRRTSTASTSSLPRTPASAHFEREPYSWVDPARLPLVGGFTSPSCDSETSSSLTCTPLTPSVATSNALTRIGEEQDTSLVKPKSTPMRALTMSSPYSVQYARVARSATFHSPSNLVGVRPWPKPPGKHPEAPDLWEEAQRLSIVEVDSDEASSEHERGSETPESEGGSLRRRKHVRRPTRAKPDLPRPLPALPSTHIHSRSTAGRYMSTPISDWDQPVTSDIRRRSHTLNNLPSTALPTPSKTLPDKRIPQLKLATLELRSLPSEAAGVLTKTPNRPSNPFGSLSVAPPMPADASSQIDWDLIGNALEVDGEMAATPNGLPKPADR